MFFRMLVLFSLSLIYIEIAESTPVLVQTSRHFLYGVPGYIPVYIRKGDTPLEEINPNLAEAFYVNAQKHNRITYGRFIGGKSDNEAIKPGYPDGIKISEVDKTFLDTDLDVEDEEPSVSKPQESKTEKPSSNIQKIPRA
ncbi:uncharacterized protein LOC126878653 [Diabrotica virgifera virgifera]|uniref:Uncharacterized protein LOC114345210 n=1 Tax=Diabrotica virgifera virgifera TaxID=50390 RepID=A0A6P7GQH2_DIAVI|nr:uncharacterized protein LOC126878653 [Diabrotica virgifera virgifera]